MNDPTPPQRRVQERQPCPYSRGCVPHATEPEFFCRGCNHDGSRWVTVGTLHDADDLDAFMAYHDHASAPPLYVIEEGER